MWTGKPEWAAYDVMSCAVFLQAGRIMKKILLINACARSESRTYRLAQYVLGQLRAGDERERSETEDRKIQLEEVKLYEEKQLLPLDEKRLQERNRYIAEGDFSSDLFYCARQFAEADEIVIAAPYWDLLFPAVLRIYFELVTVTGVAFYYTPEGIPKGLCKASRIIYVMTAGGPVGDNNFGFDYVKALAHTFYGIPETICVKAENLDIVGADPEKILQETMDTITL